MSQINVENLTLSYDGKTVIENLSFLVNKGDYICIVGENGSGKSTLIKSLLGIVKPQKGLITYSDKKCRVGYLPQQTEEQKDFPASVWEVVLSGNISKTGVFTFYRKKDKENALQNMRLLKIECLMKQCFRELSGGQKQRVLLARALCATGDVLLLDEPVTGLDPAASKEMYHIISELNRKGLTVIMVTHDVGSALENANRILHLSNESAFFSSLEEYLSSAVGKEYVRGRKE